MSESLVTVLNSGTLSNRAASGKDAPPVIDLVETCLDLMREPQADNTSARLSVVMPVFNEHRWLRPILEQIRRVPIPKQIILIDDCSTDGTRDLVRELEQEAQRHPDPHNELTVVYHERNRGKGASLRTGFQHVRGEVVIVQDADLEYSPRDYPALIAPIVQGEADVVYGSRYLGTSRRVLNFWHTRINRWLTTLSNIFTGLDLTDMETCYKVFRADVLRDIAPRLKSDRFGFEPEVTAHVARRKLRVYEVPVRYAPRSYAQGKKIRWWDGLQAVWCIISSHFAR
uniref:Glycosyltransferase family 2 protein n=1 Tax=Schlesneria paludicola TaxID=360056 RepID=A0A7C4LIM5_9PLAN